MFHLRVNDDDDMEEEYEMQGVDIMDDDIHGRDGGGSDSDVDDNDPMDSGTEDTIAPQSRDGIDIQGILWERLSITRNNYRQTRLAQYRNYENIPQSGDLSEKECKTTDKRGSYYEFRRNSRSVKSTILHFQLRNLVWATSKHDVYLMSHYSVIHWSSLKCSKSEVLNISGHIAPSEKHPGSPLEGFTQTQVSTLAVKDKLLVAGGFHGELVCKYLARPGISYCAQTIIDDNSFTDTIEIYIHQTGACWIWTRDFRELMHSQWIKRCNFPEKWMSRYNVDRHGSYHDRSDRLWCACLGLEHGPVGQDRQPILDDILCCHHCNFHFPHM